MRRFEPRTTRLSQRPSSAFAQVYQVLQTLSEKMRRKQGETNELRRNHASTLCRISLKLHLLRRETEGTAAWPSVRPFVQSMESALVDAGVKLSMPTGQPVTDEILAQVDIIASEQSPEVTVAMIDRVDKPIIEIDGRIFRGQIRILEPAKPGTGQAAEQHIDQTAEKQ